jgi:hypothetical protein
VGFLLPGVLIWETSRKKHVSWRLSAGTALKPSYMHVEVAHLRNLERAGYRPSDHSLAHSYRLKFQIISPISFANAFEVRNYCTTILVTDNAALTRVYEAYFNPLEYTPAQNLILFLFSPFFPTHFSILNKIPC